MDSLSESDVKSNLKQAFKATDAESIPRVIDYVDFLNKKKLDQLSVMTFLYQLRNYYESSLNSKEINNNKDSNMKKSSSQKLNEPILNRVEETAKSITLPTSKSNEKIKKGAYSNPFDSDDDDTTLPSFNPENTQSSKPSGLVEIKVDGKIVDAVKSKSTSKIENKAEAKPVKVKEAPKPPQPTAKTINTSDELIQKAKDLIEKNKMPPSQQVF